MADRRTYRDSASDREIHKQPRLTLGNLTWPEHINPASDSDSNHLSEVRSPSSILRSDRVSSEATREKRERERERERQRETGKERAR